MTPLNRSVRYTLRQRRPRNQFHHQRVFFHSMDLYHARQYLWDLARKLYPNQQAEQERWMVVHKDALLGEGKIEDLVASLRSIDSSNPELAEKIRIEADYFEKNTKRMRYPAFRAQHLFVGSGVIQAGCKAIIGSRCKQSGMFWTCLLYTSDAADEEDSVDLGGR